MIRQGLLIFEESSAGKWCGQRRVAGLSLLERGIRTMARVGLERLVVVVPANASLVLSRLTRKLDLTIEFTTWDSASSLVWPPDEQILVLLGDHVHHHTSLITLVKEGLEGGDLVVQTSAAPAQPGPFHQVSCSSSGVVFTPVIQASSPVSTGAFLCSSALFAQGYLAAGRSDFRLFLQTQAAGRKIIDCSQASPLWYPVRDRRNARAAKNMLFSQVTKPTSGYVSRHLNARISIPISKVLVETGLSPHLITVLFVLTTGLTSAFLITRADDYLTLVLAGLLWQLAAILDRCDGEVARVKLCESRFGAWFDTVTDNFAYLCGYIGMLFGMRRLHPDTMLYPYLGLSAFAALLLTLSILYAYARRTGSGSLQHYLRDLASDLPDRDKSWIQKLMQRYGFVAKRDFFSFFIFLTTLVNRLEIAYWFLIAVLHLAAGAVLFSQSRMVRGTARQHTARQEMPLSRAEDRR